jgi:hypothetical protein
MSPTPGLAGAGLMLAQSQALSALSTGGWHARSLTGDGAFGNREPLQLGKNRNARKTVVVPRMVTNITHASGGAAVRSSGSGRQGACGGNLAVGRPHLAKTRASGDWSLRLDTQTLTANGGSCFSSRWAFAMSTSFLRLRGLPLQKYVVAEWEARSFASTPQPRR